MRDYWAVYLQLICDWSVNHTSHSRENPKNMRMHLAKITHRFYVRPALINNAYIPINCVKVLNCSICRLSFYFLGNICSDFYVSKSISLTKYENKEWIKLLNFNILKINSWTLLHIGLWMQFTKIHVLLILFIFSRRLNWINALYQCLKNMN